MKVFNATQIKAIDLYTINNEPIAPVDLMERASQELFKAIDGLCYHSRKFVVVAGTGNNGGDGLALARLLSDAGYSVRVILVKFSEALSPECEINFDRIELNKIIQKYVIKHVSDVFFFQGEVIIDTLFGSGLTRPLKDLAFDVVQKMNSSGCEIISVDLPSGLFCDDNTGNNEAGIVKADITFTLQFPKLSFFFSENNKYTGEWKVLPIGLHPTIIEEENTPFRYTDQNEIKSYYKRRAKFSHKGDYGHALFIGGSYGKIGAAVLASRSCLKSGSGLLTTNIPECGYNILQIAVPESMVITDTCQEYISELVDITTYTAIGIGPGLGTHELTAEVLDKLIGSSVVPMVVDADAINILSANKKWFRRLPENTILTPHPKEFDRMAGKSNSSYERFLKAREFSKSNRIIIVLKGAYTQIFSPEGDVSINSTGNPGMATGGSGDVLTGMILGLLSQGYSPIEAAKMGVFLHGLAGDIAESRVGQNALVAGNIIESLSDAFITIE